MKKLVKKMTKKMLLAGLVLTVVLSTCVLSRAAKTASGSFWCGGYYVGYNDSMSTSKVTATTGFVDTLNGQRTGVNIDPKIKDKNTNKIKAGTAVHQESTKTVSKTYSCPSGYSVYSASIKHTAQVNGNTESKAVTLN